MFIELKKHHIIDSNEIFGIKYNEENKSITISYKSISRDDETLYNKSEEDFYRIQNALKGE